MREPVAGSADIQEGRRQRPAAAGRRGALARKYCGLFPRRGCLDVQLAHDLFPHLLRHGRFDRVDDPFNLTSMSTMLVPLARDSISAWTRPAASMPPAGGIMYS